MAVKENILVIDDELGIREGCRRALEPAGFDVTLAATLEEGLNQIQENAYDLILLDVMMPDGRGIDLLEPIHQKDPDSIAIIITGYATVELAIDAIKRGAYDFISKPFDTEILLMAVNQGLEKRKLSLEAKRLQAVEAEAAELARAKLEMERLDAHKSEFMLVLAHELRSPLSSVQSLVRILQHDRNNNFTLQQADVLARIETRLDFMFELIDDLLTLAVSKSISPEESLVRIDIYTVIQKVIDDFRDIAHSKQIELCYDPDGAKSLSVKASEEGLMKIFNNLIGNALKYTLEDGKVAVKIFRKVDSIEITVRDSGIGIPADALKNIWNEFYRAPNAKQMGIAGTGLGLSIVKELVERFDGVIHVESIEGQGSTFMVSFSVK